MRVKLMGRGGVKAKQWWWKEEQKSQKVVGEEVKKSKSRGGRRCIKYKTLIKVWSEIGKSKL